MSRTAAPNRVRRSSVVAAHPWVYAANRPNYDIRCNGDFVIELAHERDFTPTRPLRESLRLSREFVRERFGK